MTKKLLKTILIISISQIAFGQCDNGSEPECTCETAEVLCSINELDGYSFSMTEFQHPDDGPDPLCEGDWVPNNPTWFSFIAWCEELTITVSISNCSSPAGFFGAQVGIYSSCSTFDEVACIGDDCGNEDDKVLNASGLNIGDVYHFMIDGCLGSACDVDISVDGACTEEIADWTNGIMGPTAVCAGSEADYLVNDLDGASDFHWFVDGNEVAVTNGPDNTILWDTEGTFELCVDVSNACIEITEDPDEICTMVTVGDPNAGMITATPNPLCPGETSAISVTGYQPTPDYQEVLIVVDPSGNVVELLTDADATSITSLICGTYTVYSLNYVDGETIPIPAVGESYSGSDCTTYCCDEVSLDVVFEDTEDPQFTSAPPDVTYTCNDLLPIMEDLDATDNCAADATVVGMETGMSDLCAGGMISRTWEHMDDCGNMVMHTQNITIDPTDPSAYVNPPANVTITCADVVPPPIDLMYTNSGMGACLIEGMVSPAIDGVVDACGTTITYTWDFTDACGNNINHVQTIEIEPAPIPSFINPPADVFLNCSDPIPPSIDLEYNNGETGFCQITGFVTPSVDGQPDTCGSTITYTWSLTDPCGNLIEHTQVIQIEPTDPPMFINPPADMTIDCDAFNGFTFPNLDYTNNLTNPCDVTGDIAPMITDNTGNCGGDVIALYEFTDPCGRVISHEQIITVDPPAEATFTNLPPDMTVSCELIPPPAVALDYTNNANGVCLIDGSADPIINFDADECGGTITNEWAYSDDCGRTIMHTQTIIVEPASSPVIDNLPSDITLSCDEFLAFSPAVLDYTNNESGICLIEGNIEPDDVDPIDECGGSLTYTWEFGDACGNTLSHQQMVTVEPAAEPEFLNVPSDMTVACDDFMEDLPVLEYSNGESAACEITGEITAISSGFVDECGGSITYTWTFTDNCNRTISETQEVTFEPAEEPEFNDLPEDVTLECDEEFPNLDYLLFDNDLLSPCQIQGDSEPIITTEDNICTVTYTFTNECTGNTIEHIQLFTKMLQVDFNIEDYAEPLCPGLEFDLSTISYTDYSDTNPNITYHDALPPNNNNEIDAVITGTTQEQVVYIVGTNEYECFDFIEVTLTPEDISFAGEDSNEEICITSNPINLYDYLTLGADLTGAFTQTNGPIELEFSSANDINISDAPAGVYVFEYLVSSSAICPDDIAIITLELLPEIIVELILIECNADGLTYNVIIANDNFDIDISAGTIANITDTEITISNVPIDNPITIEIQNTITNCETTVTYNSPNCDCPTVDPPISLGNQQICEGQINPILSVTVGMDEIANWFDMPTGGNLLQSANLNYTPTESTPGLYTYYVETQSTLDPSCISPLRTPITLEIIANPILSNVIVDFCDLNESGFISIMASELEAALFNGQNNLTAIFYETETDRTNGVNSIAFPFTNSTANSQLLYASVNNVAGCVSEATTQIQINPLPVIMASSSNVTCEGFDNGEISLTIASSAMPVEVSYNNDILQNLNLTNLGPSTYTFIATDNLGCSQIQTVTIEEGINIAIENLTVICDDNDTNTDSEDDFYTVSFQVSNTNGNVGSYILTNNQNTDSPTLNYGETISLEFPANGQLANLTAIDNATSCIAETEIGILLSCSSDCELNLGLLTYECQDNDTPLDPTDDFYIFEINVSAINGGANNSYNIFIDGVLTFNYNYDEISTFNLPANNELRTLRIADNQFDNCFINETTDVLAPCSDACFIEAEIISTNCDFENTDDNLDDDTFVFELLVNGINSSSNYTITELSSTGVYDSVYLSEKFLINEGSFILTIADALDSGCTTQVEVTPPPPCSTPCEVVLNGFEISDCDNNGTGSLSEDDFYYIEVNISNILGGGTSYDLQDNLGNNYGPFDYNADVDAGPFPSDGNDIAITLIDEMNSNCLLTFTISNTPCSECAQSISLDADIDTLNCDEKTSIITYDSDEVPLGIVWQGPNNFESTDDNISISLPGVYTIIATYADGCTAENSIEIFVDGDVPIANAGENQIINCMNLTATLDGSQSNYATGATFAWTNSNGDVISTDLILITDEPGIYGFQVFDTNSQCESEISNVEVIEDFTTPSAVIFADPGNVLDCFIQSILISTDEEENTIYAWEINNIPTPAEDLELTEPANIKLIALDTISECESETELNIEDLTEFPIIQPSDNENIDCFNNESCIGVEAISVNTNVSYNWFDINGNSLGNTTSTYCTNIPGEYIIELIDDLTGCSNQDTFELNASIGAEVSLEPTIILALNQTFDIIPIIDVQESDIATIIWTGDATLSCYDCLNTSLLEYGDGDIITITITTTDGCEAQASTVVSAFDITKVYVPNIFNPSRSNFTIFSSSQIDNIEEMRIFDRWGEMVFFNENFAPNMQELGWDGTFNGKPVEVGVYVYSVRYKEGDRTKFIAGDVTLVK